MTTILNDKITTKDNLEENFSRTKQFVRDNGTVEKIVKVVLFPFSAACVVALAIRDGIDIAKRANTILSRTEYIKEHSKEFLSKYGATILALGAVGVLSYFTYNSLGKEDIEKIEQVAGDILKQDPPIPTDTSSSLLTGIVTPMASVNKLTYGDFIVSALSISSIVVSLLAANLNLDDFHKEIRPTISPKSVKEKPVEDPLKSSSALESNSQTDEMTKRISQLEQDLEATRQGFSEEIAKSAGLKKELDQKIVESETDKETIRQLQEKLTTSQKELSTLTETIKKLRADLLNLNQSKATIESSRPTELPDSSSLAPNNMSRAKGILSDISSHLTPEVLGSKKKPESLWDELNPNRSKPPETIVDIASKLSEKIHLLITRNNDLESSLENAQGLLGERPDASAPSQTTEETEELTSLRAEVQRLKEEASIAAHNKREFSKKFEGSQTALAETIEESTKTKEKLSSLEQQLTELDIKFNELKESSKEERDRIIKERDRIIEERDRIIEERNRKAQELEEAEERASRLENDRAKGLDPIYSKCETLSKENNDLKLTIKALRTEITNSQDTNEERIQAIVSKLKKSHKTETNYLIEEIAELKSKVSELTPREDEETEDPKKSTSHTEETDSKSDEAPVTSQHESPKWQSRSAGSLYGLSKHSRSQSLYIEWPSDKREPKIY